MSIEVIATAIAATSAGASIFSAAASRQAVARANRAFVWPAYSHDRDPDRTQIFRVRLHNEGPGVAYDVRWSVGSVTADENDEVVSDDALARQHASTVIRAMRPGESVPPEDGGWLEAAIALPPDDVWWPLVRWTDTAGVRWELSEQGVQSLKLDPKPLRRWSLQWWRGERDW